MAKDQEQHNESFFSKMGISAVGVNMAKRILDLNRYTQTCVCLNGESGIGKTHIVRQVAAARKPTKPFTWNGVEWTDSTPCVTVHFQHLQPEDVGVPFPARAARTQLLQEADLLLRLLDREQDGGSPKARALKEKLDKSVSRIMQNGFGDSDHFEFLLSKTFAELPPEGILFLDEWNRADKSTVQAFFTLVEDRAIHNHYLPEKLQVVAAMNPSDGAYLVNEAEKDHAIRKRLTFIAMTSNIGAWLNYASGDGNFHPMVVEFIRAMPGYLYDTKLRDVGKVFPCPATWEKVSRVLFAATEAKMELSDDAVHATCAGHVGVDAADKLAAYIRDNEIVINPEDVIHHYGAASKTRKRVQKLVARNANDVLNELCRGVSATLFSQQPNANEIRDNLGRFMGDLTNEMAIALVSSKFSHDADLADNGLRYMSEISRALNTQESYRAIITDIAKALERVDDINDATA